MTDFIAMSTKTETITRLTRKAAPLFIREVSTSEVGKVDKAAYRFPASRQCTLFWSRLAPVMAGVDVTASGQDARDHRQDDQHDPCRQDGGGL